MIENYFETSSNYEQDFDIDKVFNNQDHTIE